MVSHRVENSVGNGENAGYLIAKLKAYPDNKFIVAQIIIIPSQTKFEGKGVYWSYPVCLSVCPSQNLVGGITSKVLKLVTSNFIHR